MSEAAAASDAADEDEHRAGWFELFFDLVFVVTVSVLAHGLHGDPTAKDFLTFLVLFFPAWWAWANLMVTVNVFGSGSGRIRTVLLAAMPALGLMAAASPEGLGDRAWAYALGAAWIRLLFFGIWFARAREPGSSLPYWRPVLYCLVPALLWAVSAAVPNPWRFVLWGVAVAMEVVLLVVQSGMTVGFYDRMTVEHLVERIGLFVVIVLGESVFTTVSALAEHFTGPSAAAALFGFLVAAELALIFFTWGTGNAARGLTRAKSGHATRAIRDTVMYLPFVLVSGITVIAAALGTAVAEPDHHLPPGARWALCGGVLAFYTANAAISLRYGDHLGTVLRWYVPCLVLTPGLLLPATLSLPAWGAVGCAAGLVLLLAKLSKLSRGRDHDRTPIA
ncbi:low temperature requirement protein LtrA [Kitasatospora gansuensis]|uniref:Low temperature requirement protein LtrA n=1 Tax=Kitasatospora gansuensis TaxID=258050 RepID=A0A7W7SGC7_9ACTN|nr:low temperature requirement protein A [Kitasatospora gansuensis]MBB4949968.1 low temperature requirement protein LtrA [Kitasatospora gansuensis]